MSDILLNVNHFVLKQVGARKADEAKKKYSSKIYKITVMPAFGRCMVIEIENEKLTATREESGVGWAAFLSNSTKNSRLYNY